MEHKTNWHTLPIEEITDIYQVNPESGLSSEEASQRLSRDGANLLEESKSRPLWLKFLDQFRSFLTAVLLGAGALAWAIGDLKDAVVILIVVLFNACLGFYQEHRAEATLSALKNMLIPTARVRRDGSVLEIQSRDIVSGDLVLLEAGEQVPADGRIYHAFNLEVQEASLTGESVAVPKTETRLKEADLSLAERSNMLFMNTMLSKGRAEMLVVGTGMDTEMGRIAGMLSEQARSETPLQRQLDALGKRLAIIAGIVVLGIFGITLWQGAPWDQAAMTSVALAVASVPEGLPAVVTVTLAIGMWRMARKKAILKNLSSVETLGSTNVICTDKTGTLTLNEMTARAGWYCGELFRVTGQGYGPEGSISRSNLKPLLLPIALCNDARIQEDQLIGDPTEGGLYALAQKGGVDPLEAMERHPRVGEIPFDSENKYMATFHRENGFIMMYIKGAPDVLLAKCSRIIQEREPGQSRDSGQDDTDIQEVTLSDAHREAILKANDEMASEALRIIAVASRQIPAHEYDQKGPDSFQEDWTFLGLVGLMDPPRSEAKEAIRNCKDAGIMVKMITGDHRATAAAIAKELHLDGEVITGAELDEMDDEQMRMRIDDISVFARVSPEHKVRIVKTLQSNHHITAMTGDGVNDAPALKAANIGVAMGNGTAVTREASNLVLTDNNFVTIKDAVEQGRIIYDNIVKFVRFQLSTNIAAILTVLGATLLGTSMPFTAIQLLWINIIMDGPPAMTLGVEPGGRNLMKEPPRKAEVPILNMKRFLRLLGYGLIMMTGTLLVLQFGLQHGNQKYASTLAFTTFVLFQLFNVFNARAENRSAFGSNFFRNWRLWIALVLVLILQIIVIHWPLAGDLFSTTSLSLKDWLIAATVASSVLILDEVFKLCVRILRSASLTSRAKSWLQNSARRPF